MADPTPHFEVVPGVIDGANRDFRTSIPYASNTLAVFLNGMLSDRADPVYGWVETDPANGVFTLVTAPLAGDGLHAFFLDASVLVKLSSNPVIGSITDLSPHGVLTSSVTKGKLTPIPDISGRLFEVSE